MPTKVDSPEIVDWPNGIDGDTPLEFVQNLFRVAWNDLPTGLVRAKGHWRRQITLVDDEDWRTKITSSSCPDFVRVIAPPSPEALNGQVVHLEIAPYKVSLHNRNQYIGHVVHNFLPAGAPVPAQRYPVEFVKDFEAEHGLMVARGLLALQSAGEQ